MLTSQLSRIHPQHFLPHTLYPLSLHCAIFNLALGCRFRLVFLEISDPTSTPSIKPLSNLSEIPTRLPCHHPLIDHLPSSLLPTSPIHSIIREFEDGERLGLGFSRARAVMSVTLSESTTRFPSGTCLSRLLLCLLMYLAYLYTNYENEGSGYTLDERKCSRERLLVGYSLASLDDRLDSSW